MPEWSIRLLGIGGQGIGLSSVILAHAAVLDGLNAVQTQRYGAEVRGGEVYADVKISDGEIYSPSIDEADYMIGFAYSTLSKYINTIKDGGILFIDPDLVRQLPPTTKRIKTVYRIPATRIAAELGNVRVANVVMLGAMREITNIVTEESLLKSMELHIRKKYIEINKKAYIAGKNFVLSGRKE
ncbi:hypothetical protein DRJ00_06895 [Candidatus Aerophobetes bacterium]|uniref:Pyruvate/ketoisovalerate oxidoreductase catalytic domain-containing protein n=1 Tax=Aerophobetes bacterium TaxID=2030807 RepID=A0A497E2M0_UNCAE|nr:MAG: hypothetical protein DRJ00_06895 [Candidatus Aerophobetes bacterium]